MNKISYFFIFTFFSNNLLASPFDKFKSGFDSMKGKYDEAKSKVDEAKAKVDEVKAEVEDAKAKIKEAKDDVSGVIRDVDNKYKEITGGGANNEQYKGDTNTNKEQVLGQNDKDYVEWVERLKNLSPAGLKQLVNERNFYMLKTRELEECVKTSRNSKKFVLITDVSIDKK